jgi:4-diphosphocytidyl-2-C-methyl-D-erythritol kinase
VLNKLWGLKFKTDDLMEMGRTLGADVPIFIQGEASWAEGVGDRLTPLILDEPWYLVIIPDCHVSTKEIFSHPELTRDSLPIKITGFVSEGDGGNDCKSLVVSKYSAVAKAMDALSLYGDARLTGTGACVYAEFAGKEQAEAALEKLAGEFSCCVVKGLNSSPLLEAELV